MTLSDNARGAVLMTVAMAAFTLNDTAMKLAMQSVPLFQAIGLRGLLATFALLVIGWRMGGLRLALPVRDRWLLALRSAAEVLGTLTFLAALNHMPLANLSAILQVLPLAVTLGAALVFGERVGWRRWSAIAVGFAGVLIILQPGLRVFSPAALVPLLAAFLFALYGLLTRYVSRGDSASVSFFWTGTVAALAMTPLGLWYWEPMTRADWGWMALICCTAALGHWMLIRAYEVAEASDVQPFAYFQLVFASAIGIFLLGEALDRHVAIGAGVVVSAGLFTLWRQRIRSRGGT